MPPPQREAPSANGDSQLLGDVSFVSVEAVRSQGGSHGGSHGGSQSHGIPNSWVVTGNSMGKLMIWGYPHDLGNLHMVHYGSKAKKTYWRWRSSTSYDWYWGYQGLDLGIHPFMNPPQVGNQRSLHVFLVIHRRMEMLLMTTHITISYII